MNILHYTRGNLISRLIRMMKSWLPRICPCPGSCQESSNPHPDLRSHQSSRSQWRPQKCGSTFWAWSAVRRGPTPWLSVFHLTPSRGASRRRRMPQWRSWPVGAHNRSHHWYTYIYQITTQVRSVSLSSAVKTFENLQLRFACGRMLCTLRGFSCAPPQCVHAGRT